MTRWAAHRGAPGDLILAGQHDWVCGPNYAEELRRGIAGARVHIFAGSGHFAHVEEADAFAEVVRASWRKRTCPRVSAVERPVRFTKGSRILEWAKRAP